MKHFEKTVLVFSPPEKVFKFIDDHTQFSSHMNQSSWMMGGGSMNTTIDEGNFQKVGSHLQMSGNVFGLKLFLDEVVTQSDPPILKVWETVGIPNLMVVGDYKMTAKISAQDIGSLLMVSIDYDLPASNKWLGKLFGKFYAKWCVSMMIDGVKNHLNVMSE